MAVEYEISSDVAVIKETGSVSQCARVTQMYSGQITYDDEAGSKFATATINGKSQRVMLCIAVSGTVTYDDVPSLYSTVDGHRCLNIVTPTETGTPDDVPSLYETVVIDGQNVRAVRCIMINKTPVYDGVSSTCTFTGDDGKTHTAQLVNKVTGGSVQVIIKGTSPLNLPDAIASSLSYVKAFGGTEQRNIPQPYTQVNYVTNTAQTAVDTGIMIDFAKNYEFEVECRAVSGSWYILQSRASASGNVTGIHGETSGSNIKLVVGNVTVCTSAITRTVGNKLYVKATLNAGTATLYVKDETAGTEDTQTGSYGTTQPNPTAAVYLLGNAGGQYVDVNSDIYMARIKENDTVVMDYVPARQVATAGFYDKASGTFKTALTPANLSADGNTVPTPDAPMNIVCNNGAIKCSANLCDVKADNVEVGKYISAQGVLTDSELNFTYIKYIPVKPNTQYTLTFSSPLYFASVSEYSSAGDSGFIVRQVKYSTSTTGPFDLVEWTFTTGATTNFIRWGSNMYKNIDLTLADVLAVNYMLVQGFAQPYMPYGQIYTDGTVETINVHGKNLFDSTPYKTGYYIDASGNEVVATQYQEEYLIRQARVQPSTQYTISFKGSVSGYTQRIHAYDAAGNWLSQVAVISNVSVGVVSSESFITPANCAYIRQGGRSQTEYQLERGSTATDYVPYYDGGTATAEMLLKVDNYQDVQSIIDGVVTRNVGVKVLDGTEDWRAHSSIAGWFQFPEPLAYGGIAPALCTHYPYSSAQGTVGVYFSIGRNNPQTNRIIIADNVKFPNTGMAAEFKQWLAAQYAAGTPVIVLYPLATPTTESVAGQTLQVTDGDNTLEITQASLNGLELEAEYNAAVSLTIQEVQDANLDPNVQVTIN